MISRKARRPGAGSIGQALSPHLGKLLIPEDGCRGSIKWVGAGALAGHNLEVCPERSRATARRTEGALALSSRVRARPRTKRACGASPLVALSRYSLWYDHWRILWSREVGVHILGDAIDIASAVARSAAPSGWKEVVRGGPGSR